MFLALASFRLAVQALVRAGLRTVLTALGVLIGITAVVVVTALGTGARENISAQIESLGSNLIYVFNRSTAKSGARATVRRGLTDWDAAAIRREATAVKAVTVWSQSKGQVVSEFANTNTAIMGGDGYYFQVRDWEIERGRRWTAAEEQTKAKVCVIGQTVVTNLFGSVDPVGRYVRIGKYPFLVVGTFAKKGSSPFGDQDDRLVMPMGSYRSRIQPSVGKRVQLVIVTAKSAERVDQAKAQVDAILMQSHRLTEGEEKDYSIHTQEAFRKGQEAVFDIVTLLLVSVAGISLFVGGVGVMNIMLVSVTERTREIGIRMAIGAKARDIQLQFLIEAIGITLFGGLAGIALAAAIVVVLGYQTGWNVHLNPQAVAVALGTSVLVGIVFGFLPARRAASLDPIEALRHE